MRSFGDLPRPVLVLEGLGIVMLVLAYLSIHGHLQLPGWLAGFAAGGGRHDFPRRGADGAGGGVSGVARGAGLRAADARRVAAGKRSPQTAIER